MPVIFSLSPKDQLLLYLPKKSNHCQWALSLFDLKGNLMKEIIAFPCDDNTNVGERIISFVNEKNEIFVSYLRIPFYQKFSTEGKSLGKVSFEVPLKTPDYRVSPEAGAARVSCKKGEIVNNVLSDFTVDRHGRVFMVIFNRPKQKKEKFFLTGSGGTMARMPKEFPEKTDLHRLLVFNSDGKIIASKTLSVFSDRIYVHENRLFIIDKMRMMKIYEYKFEL
jgi:hypothetical protein